MLTIFSEEELKRRVTAELRVMSKFKDGDDLLESVVHNITKKWSLRRKSKAEKEEEIKLMRVEIKKQMKNL